MHHALFDVRGMFEARFLSTALSFLDRKECVSACKNANVVAMCALLTLVNNSSSLYLRFSIILFLSLTHSHTLSLSLFPFLSRCN